MLSALRHRAAELGDRADFARSAPTREALDRVRGAAERLRARPPGAAATSSCARRRAGARRPRLRDRPRRSSRLGRRSGGGRRLLMEDFYRDARRRHDVLMDGDGPGRRPVEPRRREPRAPARRRPIAGAGAVVARGGRDRRGGTRRPRPLGGRRRGVVRRRRRAAAVPRHPREALHRAATTSSTTGWAPSARTRTRCSPATAWLAHCCSRPPLNLGLLDPLEVVRRAETALPRSVARAPAAAHSVEGFVRQVIGWRDYIWHMYWHLGRDYRRRNALHARQPVPAWFADLDDAAVRGRCLVRRAGGPAPPTAGCTTSRG